MVVDDTAVDRRLAGGLLEQSPDFNVCYAENGQDALNKIADYLPDIVVTDLQMPNLDGLELVNCIGARFPDLPVVLMTAHGSESIAAQALASGAASYVPKNDLAESLLETVRHVLAIAGSESRNRKLVSSIRRTEFEFELDNDPELVEPLVELVQQMMDSHQLFDSQNRLRVGMAFENALSNAMLRGNLEIDRKKYPVATRDVIAQRRLEPQFCNRRVHLDFSVNTEQVRFVIRDEGPGFDLTSVPAPADPNSFRDGMGRGLVLVQSFMDEVAFEDGGRTLRMMKKRCEQPTQPR
jgi:DNA-binding NarL/FixJ family response regulator